MNTSPCPFCSIASTNDSSRLVATNDLALAIKDGFPISPGHTLIIPKRHTASFFSINSEERTSLFDLVEKCKLHLDEEYSPDAFNLGINDGEQAGQTIAHLHIHLIPRYKDDVIDPRGGVRWLIPEKADYWSNNK